GAYLQSIAMSAHASLGPASPMLWTLPMFHCNGWCFPWAVTAAGGTHRELPQVHAAHGWAALRSGGVTPLNPAPTSLFMIAYDDGANDGPCARAVRVMTGGSPPSPALLARLEFLNFDVTHLYGLTETYGPVAICDWQPEWASLPSTEQAALRARQGVPNI